ncbi:MAG: Holliday junction DNA helicase RuvA [Gammaproteobacteria bacterium RIFCSPHIGHO2_12_FULL_42_13]|nr:MAG: Holliday junction DNA helicase RuvA [Gammaproteobacteria bacterium RIFCSPHIGHO2_12_FULL_42_13]
MITHLTGILINKQPPQLTLDVNGIGYEIHAPMSTFYHLPELNNKITLLTHFVVRDDAQLLFGFLKENERKLFRELIKINGIGPKLAISILSGIEAEQFIRCIQEQDIGRLTNIPGIGKKTAQRLLVEMRDQFSQWESTLYPSTEPDPRNPNQVIQDAIHALTSLGYKPHDAKNIVTKTHQPGHNSEQLIRLSLQSIIEK